MKRTLPVIAIVALFAGCASMSPSGPSAVADLAPTTGNTAKGTVTFTQKGDQVIVHAMVSGLAAGTHGFHIHEKGDCSSGDGMSAGGHFNPLGKPHAYPTVADRHAGDMPMLAADAAGNAVLDGELDVITIGSRRDGHRRQGGDRAQGRRRLQDATHGQCRCPRGLRSHPQVLIPEPTWGPPFHHHDAAGNDSGEGCARACVLRLRLPWRDRSRLARRVTTRSRADPSRRARPGRGSGRLAAAAGRAWSSSDPMTAGS